MTNLNELLFGSEQVIFTKGFQLTLSYANTAKLVWKTGLLKPDGIQKVYKAVLDYHNEAFGAALHSENASQDYCNSLKVIYSSSLYQRNLAKLNISSETVLLDAPSFVLFVIVSQYPYIRKALRAESRSLGSGVKVFTTMVHQTVSDVLKEKEMNIPTLTLEEFSSIAAMQLMELVANTIFEDEDY